MKPGIFLGLRFFLRHAKSIAFYMISYKDTKKPERNLTGFLTVVLNLLFILLLVAQLVLQLAFLQQESPLLELKAWRFRFAHASLNHNHRWF